MRINELDTERNILWIERGMKWADVLDDHVLLVRADTFLGLSSTTMSKNDEKECVALTFKGIVQKLYINIGNHTTGKEIIAKVNAKHRKLLKQR